MINLILIISYKNINFAKKLFLSFLIQYTVLKNTKTKSQITLEDGK